jgi:hypothetical protein
MEVQGRCDLIKESAKERFEKKFKKGNINDCWDWEATVHGQGYGHFKFNGKVEKAHRFAYKLYKGEFPEYLLVLHNCDNTKCVNPDHLFLGTHQDNNDDKESKNRGNHIGGEKHYKAILTMAQVRRIREFSKCGIRNYELAKTFKISRFMVSNVILNKVYKEAITI